MKPVRNIKALAALCLVASLATLAPAANAWDGGYNTNDGYWSQDSQSSGSNWNVHDCGGSTTTTTTTTAPCGTLTATTTASGSASNFHSNMLNDATTNSGGIPGMYNNFNNSTITNTPSIDIGTLKASTGSTVYVTFTYLGSAAANNNLFTVTGGSNQAVTGSSFNNHSLSTQVGSTITDTVTNTNGSNVLLGFKFTDATTGTCVDNGGLSSNCSGGGMFSILTGGFTVAGHSFADLLLYNDSGSIDGDYNDMVVGINLSCCPVSPVPEPKDYAMLLSGLGLIGFIAIRRKGQNGITATLA